MRKPGWVLFPLTLFLSVASGLAQQPRFNEYLWPTDASKYLTSAFGEYRARRFHAGIDIKTPGKTGYNCYAVRPGYVWRISVSPYGYGKAVYLKLDTGEIAVYAHLSKLSERIQEHVEREQRRTGRYRVNLFLKAGILPVAQGQVIAYTGQTGIGAPHLHFEIRDASNRPTNPLLKGYELPDTVSPIVRKISFSPLDGQSEVNGDYQPVIVTPQWRGPGDYLVKETISLWGNVGLGISCFDKNLNAPNRYGVYSLKLFVDDVLRFGYSYDRLTFQKNPMVELDRDYLLSRRNLGRFYKLYKDKHNVINHYRPNRTWAGVIRSASLSAVTDLISKSNDSRGMKSRPGALFPGPHEYRIEVADFFGNVSTVSGTMLVGATFDMHPVIKEDETGELSMADVVTYDFQQIEDLTAHVLSRNRWQKLPFEWTPSADFGDEKGGKGSELESPLPVPNVVLSGRQSGSPLILKFEGRDQFDASSYPAYFIHGGSSESLVPPQITVLYDFYHDYVRLEITSNNILGAVPVVTLYPGRRDEQSVLIHQTGLKNYLGRIQLNELKGAEHPLLIKVENLNGKQFDNSESFLAEKVRPKTTDRIVSADGRFWVNFWSNSLYEPIYVRISPDSTTAIKDLKTVGRIYRVEPGDGLLRKGAFVHMQYPAMTSRPDKLGVFYKTKTGKWVFIDNNHDKTSRTISAKVLSFEVFALGRDEAPPEITRIRPAKNARLSSRTPRLSATVRDELSGIASENDIEFRLDGQRLIAEYDPERKRIFYQVEEPLAPGRHEMMVMAIDKLKNVTIKTSWFWIR